MPVRTFICWYRSVDATPPDEVMSRYDVIVGRGCPRERRDALRRLNPRLRCVAYRNVCDLRLIEGVEGFPLIPAAGRPRPDSVDGPYNEIWRSHREFLLKNRAGLRGAGGRAGHAWGYQNVYDPASPDANRFYLDPRSGWKEYFAELCADVVRSDGYDGVFVDNAAPCIEWIFEKCPNDLKIDFTDEEWSAAMSALLANLARRVKREFPDAPIYANTCGGFVEKGAEGIEPAAFWLGARIDGAMDEFFAFQARDGKAAYFPEPRWREQLRSLLCSEKLGRAFFAQTNGREDDFAARTYTLASFLIGAGDKSLFNYNPAAAATYPRVYRLSEWDIDLGRPLRQYASPDEALAAGQGKVYAREFERGLVFVNPREAAASVDIPAGLRRLVIAGPGVRWEPAGPRLDLPAHSAEILARA